MCAWGYRVPTAAFLPPREEISLEIICLSLMHRAPVGPSVLLLPLLSLSHLSQLDRVPRSGVKGMLADVSSVFSQLS